MPGLSDYGLARVVVAVRAATVVSLGVLLAVGPEWVRERAMATALILLAAAAYAALMLAKPSLELRRARYAAGVAAIDSILTLAIIALTGGVHSPAVSVLMLVVIASATRLKAVEAVLLSMLLAGGYFAVVMSTATDIAVAPDPTLLGAWWALYLLVAAVLVGGLSMLAEREQRSRLVALVEAEAEHAAAEEERDLRARLLQSYESQQDGLRVLLHEFRTPVASLEALSQALTDDKTPISAGDREASLLLAGAHATHLGEMLDALGDVALSRSPTFTSGRIRRVDVAELINAAADAVDLHEPRLRVTVTGDVTAVRVDAQGLRRVLTNLLENASRHGRGAPVQVVCTRADRELTISVLDRGPGIPEGSLGEVTAKFVSVGGQRGTAGLGLWIVQQIVEAMGGRLHFDARGGGGLVATFQMPVD
ncbi:MAG: HAMP domain-containing sensor histidine kinase [Rhodococcus sp. (in: high G+C Gram-positive bacteria)]